MSLIVDLVSSKADSSIIFIILMQSVLAIIQRSHGCFCIFCIFLNILCVINSQVFRVISLVRGKSLSPLVVDIKSLNLFSLIDNGLILPFEIWNILWILILIQALSLHGQGR